MKYGIKTDKKNYNAFLNLAQFQDDLVPNDYEEVSEEQFNKLLEQFKSNMENKGKALRYDGKDLIANTFAQEKIDAKKDIRNKVELENKMIEKALLILAKEYLKLDTESGKEELASMQQELKDRYEVKEDSVKSK